MVEYATIAKRIERTSIDDMLKALLALDPVRVNLVRKMANDEILSDRYNCTMFRINYADPGKNSGIVIADYAAMKILESLEKETALTHN
jgi:hypothetical protein